MLLAVKKLFPSIISVGFAVSLIGCGGENTAEKIGQSVDKAVKTAQEQVEHAKAKVKETYDEAKAKLHEGKE